MSSAPLKPIKFLSKNMPRSDIAVNPEVNSSPATTNAVKRPASDFILQLHAVSLGYSQQDSLLFECDLNLKAGGFYILGGDSGAGKTSLLRLLAIDLLPQTGYLSLFGTSLKKAKRSLRRQLRQRIGLVFQDARLLPHLNVFDNIALPLRLRQRPLAEINAHTQEMLDWLKLAPLAQAMPHQLSGGQKMQIGLARAVIFRPQLLLADEPAANLDEKARDHIQFLLVELYQRGMTIIQSSHDRKGFAQPPYQWLQIRHQQIRQQIHQQ